MHARMIGEILSSYVVSGVILIIAENIVDWLRRAVERRKDDDLVSVLFYT
jgi:hypothetical protein